MSRIVTITDESIEEAAAVIRAGGLVALPTETVYGLGANALDGHAVAKIFAAKGRPQFNPLITHFADISHVLDYVAPADMALFETLAHHFWPGPLTMVLPRKEGSPISDLVTAGLGTMAVRMPAHPGAQKLLKAAGVPIAAPSANRSGQLSPTTPQHVAAGLGDAVDMILAAGPSSVGLESTVLDLSEDTPVILRPGSITAEDIEEVLGQRIESAADNEEKVKSPGQLLKHYAPRAPLRLRAVDVKAGEALLAFGSDKFMGIEGGGRASDLPEDLYRNLSREGDLHEAAANLFRMLHDLDQASPRGIAVMDIPLRGLGIAINDRLQRAAASSTMKPD